MHTRISSKFQLVVVVKTVYTLTAHIHYRISQCSCKNFTTLCMTLPWLSRPSGHPEKCTCIKWDIQKLRTQYCSSSWSLFYSTSTRCSVKMTQKSTDVPSRDKTPKSYWQNTSKWHWEKLQRSCSILVIPLISIHHHMFKLHSTRQQHIILVKIRTAILKSSLNSLTFSGISYRGIIHQRYTDRRNVLLSEYCGTSGSPSCARQVYLTVLG